ncbi:hypothetical protein HK405_006901, partial [Cladochytrium tenue]
PAAATECSRVCSVPRDRLLLACIIDGDGVIRANATLPAAAGALDPTTVLDLLLQAALEPMQALASMKKRGSAGVSGGSARHSPARPRYLSLSILDPEAVMYSMSSTDASGAAAATAVPSGLLDLGFVRELEAAVRALALPLKLRVVVVPMQPPPPPPPSRMASGASSVRTVLGPRSWSTAASYASDGWSRSASAVTDTSSWAGEDATEAATALSSLSPLSEPARPLALSSGIKYRGPRRTGSSTATVESVLSAGSFAAEDEFDYQLDSSGGRSAKAQRRGGGQYWAMEQSAACSREDDGGTASSERPGQPMSCTQVVIYILFLVPFWRFVFAQLLGALHGGDRSAAKPVTVAGARRPISN